MLLSREIKRWGWPASRNCTTYGRQLQLAGKQEEAFAVFRTISRKIPIIGWSARKLRRLAVAKGDYDGATKEMKLALAAAPGPAKPTLEGFIKRLEAKEDINK